MTVASGITGDSMAVPETQRESSLEPVQVTLVEKQRLSAVDSELTDGGKAIT